MDYSGSMWVRAVIAVGACGCYGATAPAGAPCDPTTSNCPEHQVCTSQPGGYYCLFPGSDDGAVGGQNHFEFPAAVAECIEPSTPDPAFCRSSNGNHELVADIKDSTTMKPWHGFVRFDPANTLAARTITSVTLRMVATNASNAAGPSSGEIWAVQPFALADLSVAEPAKVGVVLAPDQGAVTKLQTVDWPLPTTAVPPTGSVYLGLFPTGSDGVNYWNIDGATPPRLLVDAQ
jgi:hypothetical protein